MSFDLEASIGSVNPQRKGLRPRPRDATWIGKLRDTPSAFALAIAVSACGGSDDGGSTPVPVPAFVITGAAAQVETGSQLRLGSTLAPGIAGMSYRWDFGDGSSSSALSPDKIFASSGVFTVSLTVTGPAGDSKTASSNVVAGRFSLTEDRLCVGSVPRTGWCRLARPPDAAISMFVDANHGWAVGDSSSFDTAGVVFRTTDGGTTWTPHKVGPRYLSRVAFADQNNGIVLANAAEVGKTPQYETWATGDGGRNWVLRGSAPGNAASALYFVSADASKVVLDPFGFGRALRISVDGGVTWATTPDRPSAFTGSGTSYQLDGKQVLRSTDLGATFSAITLAGADALTRIAFSDPSHGWVIGSNTSLGTSIWQTIDGGLTWTRKDLAPGSGVPSANPLSMQAYGSDGLWVTDGEHGINFRRPVYRSTDAGATWREILPAGYLAREGQGPVASVVSANAAYSVACSYFTLTRDGGTTWTDIPLPAGAPGQCYTGTILPGTSPNHAFAKADDGRLLVTADAGASWNQIFGPGPGHPQSLRLFGVVFHDFLNWSSFTKASQDGGRTWFDKPAAAVPPGNAQYGGGGLGWASVDSALEVARTTDTGQTWLRMPLPEAGTLTSRSGSVSGVLHFIDDKQGWIYRSGLNLFGSIAPGSAVWSTVDGGLTWVGIGTGPLISARWIRFASSMTGWLADDDGSLWQTRDGGRTWQARAADGIFGGPYFVNEKLGFSLGGTTVSRTVDGGASWTTIDLGVSSPSERRELSGIRFADERTGWIVGSEGLVLITRDGGLTWARQASGTYGDLVAVYATDARTAWAVDSQGWPIVTATGGD